MNNAIYWFGGGIGALGLVGFGVLLGQSSAASQRQQAPVASQAHQPAATPPLSETDLEFTPRVAARVLSPLFNLLDCEQQGFYQQPEIDEHFSQLIPRFDPNVSRTISLSEYIRGSRGRAERQVLVAQYQRIDKDKSGEVSSKEFRDHLYEMHELADTNKDGEVSREELEVLKQ